MSGFAALATLLLFSGSAVAQVSAPNCAYPALYDWAYNSLNQSPCTVAAYLGSTCHSDSYTVYPLPTGSLYYSPTTLNADSCTCNSVFYSLISACSECQGGLWSSWSQFTYNCTTKQPPVSFPNPVPSGTRVPHWALLDITIESDFDSVKALDAGITPEIGPGALISTGTTTSSPRASTLRASSAFTSPDSPFPTITSSSSDSSSSSSSGGNKTNVGAIAGASVGGVAVIAIIVLGVIYLRRERPKAPSAAFVANVAPGPYAEAQKPLSDDGTHPSSWMPDTPVSSMKVYDPNDSTTFPGYQATQHMPEVSVQQHILPPHDGNANTLANMQMSRVQGYSGLPTV